MCVCVFPFALWLDAVCLAPKPSPFFTKTYRVFTKLYRVFAKLYRVFAKLYRNFIVRRRPLPLPDYGP